MVAQLLFDCCKHGHPWTEKTTMICNGRRRCRICHNRRTNAYIKKRYKEDKAFRKKRCIMAMLRYYRKQNRKPPHVRTKENSRTATRDQQPHSYHQEPN